MPGRLPKTETGLSSSERGGTNEREMGINENDAVTVMLYVSARLEIAANSSAGLCLHMRCLLHVVSISFSQEFKFALEVTICQTVLALQGVLPLCKQCTCTSHD